MTPEETKLRSQIGRAEALMFIFGFIALGVALFVALSFFSYSSVPEGVYGQMRLMFQVYIWGPLIIFPLAGFFIAWAQKQGLAERLSEMVKKDE